MNRLIVYTVQHNFYIAPDSCDWPPSAATNQRRRPSSPSSFVPSWRHSLKVMDILLSPLKFWLLIPCFQSYLTLPVCTWSDRRGSSTSTLLASPFLPYCAGEVAPRGVGFVVGVGKASESEEKEKARVFGVGGGGLGWEGDSRCRSWRSR